MKRGFIAVVFVESRESRFILGKTAVELLLDTVHELHPEKVYVVANEEEKKGSAKFKLGEVFAEAKNVLGRKNRGDVLFLSTGFPLLTASTLESLLLQHKKEGNALTVMSKDCEVCLFCAVELLSSSAFLSPSPQQKLSLFRVADIFIREGKKVGVHQARHPEELVPVRSGEALSKAIEVFRERKFRSLREGGVTLLDPVTTWIDLTVKIGKGTLLYPSVIIEGESEIGEGCQLYPFVHLIRSRVGNRVKILSSTVIEDSVIDDDVQVGPFAHLRANSYLKPGSKVGNFVEMKKTIFGRKSKAMHLSYLGDAEIGEEVNIGAGTITCNYDGVKKSKTVIERGAFIGSGTELVAPVKVGKGAYIGAGSTITRNVSSDALAIARSRQVEIPGWAKRKRKKA